MGHNRPRQGAARVHVLEVVGALNVGGAERMILNAVRHLSEHAGAPAVDFLVFGNEAGVLEEEAVAAGARVLRMDRPDRLRPWKFVGELRGLLRTHGPFDVVHSHLNLASGPVLAAAALAHVPTRIAHSHNTADAQGGPWRAAYGQLSKALIRAAATQMVACGHEAGRFLFGKSWDAHGVAVPNGIDIDAFAPNLSDRLRVRAEWGVSSEALVAGSVARLAPAKNHAFMIDVMAAELRAGRDAHLMIVGDGPLRIDLEAKVRRLSLQGRVHFLGVRDDVSRVLAGLDVVLMPSHHEGLPVALVEAQASGTPVLASYAVSREADLGLGLVEFLPKDSIHGWTRALESRLPTSVALPPDRLRAQLRARGYDATQTAEALARLYGVGR